MKKILIGFLILSVVGLACVAVIGTDEATFHLQRANNILRRWKCPPGGFSTAGGSNGDCLCKMCPVGRRCAGGSSPPRLCQPGTFQNHRAQNACKPSPVGHHVPNAGASKATKCPRGTYQRMKGQSKCVAASKGNYVGTSGATGETKCPKGTYADVRRLSVCKKCTPGHKCDQLGLVLPRKCNYGTYQNKQGQTRCKPCPSAHSCPSRGLHRPQGCSKNTYQSCTGQIACIPCEPGFGSRLRSTRCLATFAFRPGGCLRDTNKRILRAKHTKSNKMTTGKCARFCSGFRFFGTQAGLWCFCGDRFDGSIRRSGSCTMKCPGNRNQICGGPWAMTVFRRY